ncbi:MAG: hypothetical protein HZLCBSQH_001983 [Candidatus Fervidibacterota bacterium]
MKQREWLLGIVIFAAVTAGRAQPVSPQDRVYTADQISNTVSVIDPSTNRLLGHIVLGRAQPDILSPLYRGQALVHGLGFSPDHRTLVVVSIGSNSVTFIDTATNRIKGVVYIGRSPHEAFFTPDGKEVWVAVRGENYLSVIDPKRLREVRRIPVADGPGMVLFRPDGKYAFVCHSFTPELHVVDVKRKRVVKRIPVVSPFSPNLAVSADGREVWLTHKDVGKVTVVDGFSRKVLKVLNTGPITNHVALVDLPEGKFAYVTVGGEGVVKVFRRAPDFRQVAVISVGSLPHGIWASGDHSRVYVGLENEDAVVAIDTRTRQVIARIPVGQGPMALVYVPNAVPKGFSGTENLAPPLQLPTKVVNLKPFADVNGNGTIVVRAQGLTDFVLITLKNMEPETDYAVYLSRSEKPPFSPDFLLAIVRTDKQGNGTGQALGPVLKIWSPKHPATEAPYRAIVVWKVGNEKGQPVLMATTSQ